MQKQLPDFYYVHIKTFFAGRPIVCDDCNEELWYPYSEKYSEAKFYCMVSNSDNPVSSQILCEKCMRKYKENVVILKKNEVPEEVVEAVNKAIVNCIMAIVPQNNGKIYFSYFDPMSKDIDRSYLSQEEAGLLMGMIRQFTDSVGRVIEILD